MNIPSAKPLSTATPVDRTPTSLLRRKLNSFQRTMLQWDSMHAYNAVHVVRIAGALDTARLGLVINEILNARSVARVMLEPSRGVYYCSGGPASYELTTLPCEEDARPSLLLEIERQLNTPFVQAGSFKPFRFFVSPADTHFLLGLAYLHAVADAVAVVLLLREIVEAYIGKKTRDFKPQRGATEFKTPSVSKLPILIRKLAALPSFIRDLRTSLRPHYRDAQDLSNRFCLFSLKPSQMLALLETAKAWTATVNDLLLALLLKSLRRLAVGGRANQGRRRKISIGCIVNARKDLNPGASGDLGLFLGSFVVTHETPENIGLQQLVQAIARHTRQIKATRLYLGTAAELAFARFMLSFYSTERRKKLYQKHYPLWGGLTNMNVNSLWHAEENAQPIDYIRAVSTGPVTPLVLSFTTSGETANVGLSYRATVFSSEDMERFRTCFLDTLSGLEARP